MTNEISKELVTKLAKAKTSLILEHPFWGTLAMNMETVITDQVPTAATNGKVILFNPDYMDTQTDEEVRFVVAHEIGHPMFEHLTRRGSRDPMKWNMAADYVINRLLIEENIGKMPEGCLDDIDLFTAGEGVTDKIYKLLPDNPGGDGQGGGFTLEGDLQGDAQSEAERGQMENEWRIKVSQAAQAAKMMGKLSANMERFVGQLTKSKVNWREVLQQFITKIRDDDRTWGRANRRMAANGVYLPGRTGETIGELVFAVDCSGSIGKDELNDFATEVHTVKDEHRPSAIHVVYFDSEVCHYDRFERDGDLSIKAHGGGGTAFSPVFRYLDEHNIVPEATIFLTDLDCSDFGPQPEYPVLWVTNYREEAPFGEVVRMEGV